MPIGPRRDGSSQNQEVAYVRLPPDQTTQCSYPATHFKWRAFLPRRDDIVTIVIDTKNEMKRSIDGLGARVNDLERDLRAAFTTEVAGLRETALADVKSSQHETRTSAYNAGKRASEAVAAVADLRRDVDRLHHGLEGLREDVGKILKALQVAAPTRVPASVGSAEDPFPDQAGASTGPGPDPVVVPGQRQAPDQEAAPQVEPAAAEFSADNSPGGDEPGASTEPDAPTADEDEADQSPPEAEQSAPEANSREEGDHDVSRAALEASEQGPSDPVKEPSPLTWEGRIWAIMRAASVASATLVCHRDTWEFVAAQVGSHPHFRTRPSKNARTAVWPRSSPAGRWSPCSWPSTARRKPPYASRTARTPRS
jgi:hypothetical protein